MKKEITIGQALAIAVTIITTLITGWITTTNKIKAIEVKVEYLEQSKEKLESKIDAIQSDTRQILINLERKEDRRKTYDKDSNQ